MKKSINCRYLKQKGTVPDGTLLLSLPGYPPAKARGYFMSSRMAGLGLVTEQLMLILFSISYI